MVGPAPVGTPPWAFSLRNVRKRYSERDPFALQVDSLEIPAGQVIAIIGYNGSGKTTLLNLLGLLDQPDSSWEGRSIRFASTEGIVELTALEEEDSREARARFGFVFQQGYLLENLPCRENIRIPPLLRKLRLAKDDIDEMIKGVGVETEYAERQPSNVSAGQRQRIAVLRALSHGPRVVFADEPTSNLDKDSATRILRMLKGWVRNGSPARTVLLVTHNTVNAAEFADSAILMAGGQVRKFQGKELSEEGLNSELAKFQKEVQQGADDDPLSGAHILPVPRVSPSPVVDILRFACKFAWNDVFSFGGRIGAGGSPWRWFKFRKTQFPRILALSLAVLLALFFARLFLALSGYLAYTVSDSAIDSVKVLSRQTGGQRLGPGDLTVLGSLAWVGGSIQPPPPGQEGHAKKVVKMAIPERNVRLGTEALTCDYLPCGTSLDAASVPVVDPILAKIHVLKGPDLKHLKESGQTGQSLFLKEGRTPPAAGSEVIPDGDLDAAKFGIVCTPEALQGLKYERDPGQIPIKGMKRGAEIPVLGLVADLPGGQGCLITEGLYLEGFFQDGGTGNPEPDYGQITLYLSDLLGDGLPLCRALRRMGYQAEPGKEILLTWVVNLIGYIKIFAAVAVAGLMLVIFGQLLQSYWQTVRAKEKEIGVLLAYGIRSWHLYLAFLLEVGIVWAVATLIAVSVDGLAVSRLVQLAYASVPHGGAAPLMSAPLWATIVGASALITMLSVVPALLTVETKRVANMLKAGN